ncbi:MAG: hypothetical protein ACI3ZC_03735 [Candidatus Cryptobacteroides sp.]
MDSPFTFDKPVTGRYFIGRRSDCNALSNIIVHGQNAAIWAPPKSGKRSAVCQTLFNLRSSGKPFILCSLQLGNIRTPEAFIRKFAGELLKASASTSDEMSELAGKYLDGTSLVFDPAYYAETGEVFRGTFPLAEDEYLSVIEMPYLISREKGTGIVIVLEEFQNLDSEPGEKLFKCMETVMSAHRDTCDPFCSWIFEGSGVNAMNGIFRRRHFFWNIVERVSLSALTTTEISESVLKGFMSGGKVIDRELLQGVCSLFRNNIWYINQFFFICDSLTRGYISELTLGDALSCVIALHEPGFRRIMDDLTAFQERLLKAVLDGVVKFSTTEVIEKYALNSSANVKRLKDALMKKEVITFNDKDEPEVMDPLFEYWLRHNYFKMDK